MKEHPWLVWGPPQGAPADLFDIRVSAARTEEIVSSFILTPNRRYVVVTSEIWRACRLLEQRESEEPIPNLVLALAVEAQSDLDRLPVLVRAPAGGRALAPSPREPIDLARWLCPHVECHACGEVLPKALPLARIGHLADCPACGAEGKLRAFTDNPIPFDGVIVRPPSRKARPMHPGWIRMLRDQAEGANVPFAFLGWGEWVEVPFEERGRAGDLWIHGDGSVDPWGRHQPALGDSPPPRFPDVLMRKVGAENSGRLLDGVVYDACPMKRSPVAAAAKGRPPARAPASFQGGGQFRPPQRRSGF